MSDDLVSRARHGIETFSRGEHDAALEGFSTDIRWEVSAEITPDATVYEGHEGVRAFWAQWRELFERFELEVLESEVVDDRHVLIATRAHGVGAGSGVSVDSPRFVQLFEFSEDKIVRVRLAGTRKDALAGSRVA